MSESHSPRFSETEMTELVLPQHANAIGTAFGGTIMSWIDICAAISAQRHCGRIAVTASVDGLDFLAPIRVGDVVCLHARVNAVFRTSMEVGVTIERERPDRSRVLCAESRLTFVNIGEDGQPMPIPPLTLENNLDRDLDSAARQRRAERLSRRSKPPSA